MLTSLAAILSQGHIYLTLYVYLAAAMLLELFYENDMVSRWLARVGALAIILFIGLRWETGTDWLSYIKIFYTNDTSSDYDSALFGIDQGYILFNHIMYSVSSDYSLFLLVDATLAVGMVYVFIEKSTKFPNMAVYLFYTSYAITHFMGSNRRMLAIGLVCVGFLFLQKNGRLWRGWPRWMVPFAIGAMIHRTSVAALPGLLVGSRRWPTIAVVLGLLACLVLGVSGAPFAALETLGNLLSKFTGLAIVDKLTFYTSGESDLNTNVSVVTQAILGVVKRSTVLAIFITYFHYAKPSDYALKLYKIYIIGCALYFVMVSAPIFQIVSTYYSIVEIVLLPIIFHDLRGAKVPYSLYLLIIPFFLMVSALSPYLELYVPYRSILTTY